MYLVVYLLRRLFISQLPEAMNLRIATIGVISTTLGQHWLIHLLLPVWVATHSIGLLIQLLVLNCGIAGLLWITD
ncbi:MAG TPA: hypothetical protein V6C65_18525 [Allocoleopsis sp.]